MIPPTCGDWTSQIHRDRKYSGGCQSCCLEGKEFQSGKMKTILEIDGGHDCTYIKMNVLNATEHTLKNGQNGKFKK